MATQTQVKTGPGQFSDMKQKVQGILGDAPEMMKSALENTLRELKAGQASRMGSAGRVGSRQGTVSELTVIAPLKKGEADRLRGLLTLLNGDFSGADKVGTLHAMRFLFLDNDTQW